MAVLLQLDFVIPETLSAKLDAAHPEVKQLAESITKEPGFICKIWTEDLDNNHAGGIYLFASKEHADTYSQMHNQRLAALGITQIRSKVFNINRPLTAITGPQLTEIISLLV